MYSFWHLNPQLGIYFENIRRKIIYTRDYPSGRRNFSWCQKHSSDSHLFSVVYHGLWKLRILIDVFCRKTLLSLTLYWNDCQFRTSVLYGKSNYRDMDKHFSVCKLSQFYSNLESIQFRLNNYCQFYCTIIKSTVLELRIIFTISLALATMSLPIVNLFQTVISQMWI